jgi:nitrate/TMAO reductase-like tetraheme cytochrome c subunit
MPIVNSTQKTWAASTVISRPMQFEEWKKEREETKNASTQNRVGASASDTAVPNGSGAKVIQNLENAKNFYKNNANRARGFITDVAQALDLEQHEASKYGYV